MPLTDWKILPHRDIEAFSEHLWQIEGDLEHLPIGRRMVMVRMDDGRLVIHNAICVSEQCMARIEAWGEPAFVIVPNAFHRIDAPRWAARYPKAKVLTSSAAKKKVLERVRVDGDIEELPRTERLELIPLRGSKVGEAAMRVSDPSGTSLVFNDTVMNNHRNSGSLWWNFFALTGSLGGPKVTGLMKLTGVSNKAELKAHLLELSQTPGLVRIFPGHGEVIREHASDVLRGIAAKL